MSFLPHFASISASPRLQPGVQSHAKTHKDSCCLAPLALAHGILSLPRARNPRIPAAQAPPAMRYSITGVLQPMRTQRRIPQSNSSGVGYQFAAYTRCGAAAAQIVCEGEEPGRVRACVRACWPSHVRCCNARHQAKGATRRAHLWCNISTEFHPPKWSWSILVVQKVGNLCRQPRSHAPIPYCAVDFDGN